MLRTGNRTLTTILIAAAALMGPVTQASASFDEALAAIKDGKYGLAFEHLKEPVMGTVDDGVRVLEEGTCAAVSSTMPPLERGIAVLEALVGDVYYFGHGVPKDYTDAVKWYQRAAEKGNALSQSTLGDIYYYGYGVPQNYTEAVKWWQLAAEQGINIAQLNLSVMYANGSGLPRDLVKSHMYANLATGALPPGKDRDTAASNLAHVATLMTPEQIAEAQDLAKLWRPKTLNLTNLSNTGDRSVHQELLDLSDGKNSPQGAGAAVKPEKIICKW